MIDQFPKVLAADAVDLLILPDEPDVSPAERAAIAARWATTSAGNPGLWNGPFFLFGDAALDPDGAVFRAQGFRTDFASFLHWRAGDPPDPRWRHVFPVGGVISADERLMVGRMSATTANPGRCYPPSGSFDPHDLVGDRLDPMANIFREIGEEVGIDASGWARDPGWLVIGPRPRRHGLLKVLRAPHTAAVLPQRARDHMAGEAEPELDGVDFVPLGHALDAVRTVPYVNLLLAHLGETR